MKIEFSICTLLIIKLKMLNFNFSVTFHNPSLSSNKLYLETPTPLFLLAYEIISCKACMISVMVSYTKEKNVKAEYSSEKVVIR